MKAARVRRVAQEMQRIKRTRLPIVQVGCVERRVRTHGAYCRPSAAKCRSCRASAAAPPCFMFYHVRQTYSGRPR